MATAASSSSTASALPTSPGTKIILVAPPTDWASWTPAERNGVIAACVIAGIGLLAILLTIAYLTHRRKTHTKRHTRGPSDGSNTSRRRSRSRIRELAALASRPQIPPIARKKWWQFRSKKKGKRRGIEGLENVELGSAAARAFFEDTNGVGRGGMGGGTGTGTGLAVGSRGATAGGGTAGTAGNAGGAGTVGLARGAGGERERGRRGEMSVMSGPAQGTQRSSGADEGWMRVVGSQEDLNSRKG